MAVNGRAYNELLPLYAESSRASFVLQGDGVRYDSASPKCRTRRINEAIELLVEESPKAHQESVLLTVGVTYGAVERLEDLAREVLRYRAGLLLPIEMKEFQSRVDGRVVLVTCAVQRLPKGNLLSRSSVSVSKLSEAVRSLEQGMMQRGLSFGELSTDSIIYGIDGKLYPFGYGSLSFGVSGERIHEECESLRERVGVERVGGEPLDLEDDFSDPYSSSLIDSERGFLRCRAPHEDRIAVEGVDGWGFIDSEGRVIVEPRYHWVSDFKEGRAEVCIVKDGLFGVIDRNGVGLSVGESPMFDELLDSDESIIIRNQLLSKKRT